MRITHRCTYGVDISHGGASCTVTHSKTRNSLFISCLYSERDSRGQGHATALLKAITRYAKRRGMVVGLEASPFRDKPMKLERLVSWYERRGFVKTQWKDRMSQYMEWYP